MIHNASSSNRPAAEFLFHRALELSTEERAAFLASACGDDTALRQRLEALLRANDASSRFLPEAPVGIADHPSNPSPADSTTPRVLPVEQTGDRVGRYHLLQKIGEGGCGVVYMAEQEDPIRRRVALKVIKLGMDTKNVIARFEAERQALALMDHPHIAKVFDAGATDTGRPYFVMELVRGVKITEYCDEVKLSTGQRLDLFIQVCQAIQHAHHKGIVHRDIKPSNVLVTVNDGIPVPKVIDFGIAKATGGQRLTDKTLFTSFEQLIGTPAYMSPEQAVMTSQDIDTRSDIYALGVLLYELLTGKTPFDPNELLAAGFDEMRRTIREQEPLRPSTRLSSLPGEELSTTAQRRGLQAPRLVNSLRGDLDWIVMKALEKDRARRYETANGLANDVQRHLNDEPIVARPPSAAYRFQKLVRRNKLACAAALGTGAALVLGAAISTWQAIRATRAETEQNRARQDAEKAQASEAKQRADSEQRFYDLLVSLAAAKRREHGVGYRDEAFKFLQQAAALNPPQKNAAVLRNLAVGCLGDFTGLTPITLTNFPANEEIDQARIDSTGYLTGLLLTDGTIQLRKLFSGGEIVHLNAEGEQPAFTFVFSDDGREIVSGHFMKKQTRERTSEENRLRIWRPGPDGHWRERQSIAVPGVHNLGYANGRMVVFFYDAQSHLCRLVDLETTNTVVQFEHFERPQAVLWGRHGRLLATAMRSSPTSDTLVIHLWDRQSGQKLASAQTDLEDLASLVISSDDKYLACLAWTGGAIYSLPTLDRVADLPGMFARGTTASFARNDTLIALPMDHRRIRLWNWVTKRDVTILEDPESSDRAAFADNDRLLFTSGRRQARVYQLSRTTERMILPNRGSFASLVGFSLDSTRVASLGGDGKLIVRDLRTGDKLWEADAVPELGDSKVDVGFASFGPNGLLATAALCTNQAASGLAIWDERTRRRLLKVGGDAPPFLGEPRFTSDGRYLAASGGRDRAVNDPELNIWKVEQGGNTGELALTHVRKLKMGGWYEFAPDNRHFSCGIERKDGLGPGIYLGELDGQAPLRLLAMHHGGFTGPAGASFTPDGRQLLSFNTNREIVTLDIATGALAAPAVQTIGPAPATSSRSLSISLSPDGSKLAVTSGSGFGVDIWDWKTRRRLFALPDQGGHVLWFTWSPDSQRLAVFDELTGNSIWNLTEIEQQLAQLGLPTKGSPSGQTAE